MKGVVLLSINNGPEVSNEPTSDPQREPVVTELERELLRQIGQGGISGALVELGRQSKERYEAVAASVQALHTHVKTSDETNTHRHESVLAALRTLTDRQAEHDQEHKGEHAHRAKQDSIHELDDAKQDEAIRGLEVDRVRLARDQSELALGQTRLALELSKSSEAKSVAWAKGGKVGAVLGVGGAALEATFRAVGVDGILGMVKTIFGGN